MYPLFRRTLLPAAMRATGAGGTLRTAFGELRPVAAASTTQVQHWRQQHRSMASNRSERLTVHQKRKTSRALARARRIRDASMAEVLSAESWGGHESFMRQGLRELDDMDSTKKQRDMYTSKPLMPQVAEDSDYDEEETMSPQEVWAERVQDIWNDIVRADARASKPRVILPGFPITVHKVTIARDYGFQKIFWDLTGEQSRPPDTLVRQLREAKRQGHDLELVVLKSTTERLRKQEGYLRACLARRVPLRKIPEIRWQHISEMPITLMLRE